MRVAYSLLLLLLLLGTASYALGQSGDGAVADELARDLLRVDDAIKGLSTESKAEVHAAALQLVRDALKAAAGNRPAGNGHVRSDSPGAAPAAAAATIAAAAPTAASCNSCVIGPSSGSTLVCGADGLTYGSSCLATCQNIKVKSNGACATDSATSGMFATVTSRDVANTAAMTKYSSEGYKMVGKAATAAIDPAREASSQPCKFSNKAAVSTRGSMRYDLATGFIYRSSGAAGSTRNGDAKDVASSSDSSDGYTPPDLLKAAANQTIPLDSDKILPTLNGLVGGSLNAMGTGTGNSTAAAAVAAKAAAGTDTRVENTYYCWLYARITLLTGATACSGVMVGPRAVLTSAQCIYSRQAKKWITNGLRVIPGAYYTDTNVYSKPFGEVSATAITTYTEYLSSGDRVYDIAVIRLGQDVGSSCGWYGLLQTPGTVNDYMWSIGYPSDKRRGSSWSDYPSTYPTVDTKSDGILEHHLTTKAGQTGSLLLTYTNDKYVVRGVHGYSAGCGMSRNHGPALDATDVANIGRWK